MKNFLFELLVYYIDILRISKDTIKELANRKKTILEYLMIIYMLFISIPGLILIGPIAVFFQFLFRHDDLDDLDDSEN